MKYAFNPLARVAPIALSGALLLSPALAAASPDLGASQGLVNWQTAGDVAILSGAVLGLELGPQATFVLGTAIVGDADDAGYAPGAFNLSGLDPVGAGQSPAVEDPLALPQGSFGPDATEGSSMAQTITVAAGDTLSFQWRLATRTPAAILGSEADAAWFSVASGSGTSLVKLGAIDNLSLVGNASGWLDSGWRSFTWTASQAGTLTIGLAVTDQSGFTDTSWLAVRSMAITTSVPEPSTWALALMGLGLAAVARRRQP